LRIIVPYVYLTRKYVHGYPDLDNPRLRDDAFECADSSSAIDYEYSPLLLAVEEGLRDVVELLVANGAGINGKAKDPKCQAPLHAAARCCRADLAEWLLSRGADVKTKDISELTPLHLAAMYGSAEVAKLLLSNGADPNARDADRKTPLEELCGATRWGRSRNPALVATARVLLAGGADAKALVHYEGGLNREKLSCNEYPDLEELLLQYMGSS
jgi:hypothetical protein